MSSTVFCSLTDAEWCEAAAAGLAPSERGRLQQAAGEVAAVLQDHPADTGERLADHAACVAVILADLGADASTRISAVLSVLPQALGDAAVEQTAAMRRDYGPEVVTLVQGTRALLRLGAIAGQTNDTVVAGTDQKEMQRKMLLAMAADLRIVLMRLASRLQTLRWHARSKTPCPDALATETLSLYTPLANRLGIWQLKWEMEDLAFRFLHPGTYREIATKLENKRAEREALIASVMDMLKDVLAQEGITAEVSGRPKHIYSIWNKMRNKDLAF